jgi:hypothetical protein
VPIASKVIEELNVFKVMFDVAEVIPVPSVVVVVNVHVKVVEVFRGERQRFAGVERKNTVSRRPED